MLLQLIARQTSNLRVSAALCPVVTLTDFLALNCISCLEMLVMSFRLACFMLECFILASHCIHSVSCSHLPRSVISALAKFLCPDMPKLSMKSRAPAWPAPKRGKVRANMKKPAGQMKKLSAKPPCVPYTRVKGVQTKFRKERCRYGVSIQSLTSMPAARLLQKLTEMASCQSGLALNVLIVQLVVWVLCISFGRSRSGSIGAHTRVVKNESSRTTSIQFSLVDMVLKLLH